ncbi:MAG: transcriptional regulator FilR1 domain-containing protein [Halobacteriota archaeon]|nr:transcriptional regulator FilR1 domain-containing protein [Halobacteriota archaeon]
MEYRYEPEKELEFLRIFGRSEIRIRILLALGGSEAKIGKLSEELNLTTSNIIHAMKALEDMEIVEKDREVYSLTNIGYIIYTIFNDVIGSISALTKNREFWFSHDISGIPIHLERSIGLLRNCEVIKSTPDDVIKAYSNFIEQISLARDMKGVSPIYCIEFYHRVKALLKNKINVELILTEVVLEAILEADEEEPDFLKEAHSDGYVRLFMVDDDVKVAFTITDSVISLGFFDDKGNYDLANDLVGYDEGALEWGRQLYEYYRNQAREVKL